MNAARRAGPAPHTLGRTYARSIGAGARQVYPFPQRGAEGPAEGDRGHLQGERTARAATAVPQVLLGLAHTQVRMGTLRLREAKALAHVHTASQGLGWDLNSGLTGRPQEL